VRKTPAGGSTQRKASVADTCDRNARSATPRSVSTVTEAVTVALAGRAAAVRGRLAAVSGRRGGAAVLGRRGSSSADASCCRAFRNFRSTRRRHFTGRRKRF